MGVAGRLHRGVKGQGVRVIRAPIRVQHRRQIAPAAEPALGRGDEAGVHMHRRNPGADRVADQADPGGEEPGILRRPRHRLGVVSRKRSVHGRDMDPDLLEQPAVHHPHDAPAACLAVPRRPHEPPGLPRKQIIGGRILQRLEGRMDTVAQMLEPGAGLDLLQVERIGKGGVAHGAS